MSPATVANWIDQGHLKGHKTPTGRRRVLGADLIAFLKAHEMPVPPELVAGGGPDTAVVVDDNATFLRALVRTIENADLDVEVVEAANGMDALLEIGRTQPAVVLLDYALPDMSGYDVIKRLLEPGRSLDAEVLVITGGIKEEEEARLRELGVRTIISKSDGMPAIIEAMRQALRRKKAA